MKIICIGRNYAEHAKELGNEIPEEPVIFMKPETALYDIKEPFFIPDFISSLHYECELVLHICKTGKNVSEKQASEYYNAITVGIDFTARDVQDYCKKKGLPWEKAKAFDNSAVVGQMTPIVQPIDIKKIQFSFLKNGQKVQDGNSADMLFNFNSIIHHITKYFRINEGDLIFTGTPAGVGECKSGDKLEAFLEDRSLLKMEIS